MAGITMSVVLILVTLIVVSLGEEMFRSGQPLWPKPVNAELGKETFDISVGFTFVTADASAKSHRLQRACDRYSKLMDVQSNRQLNHLGDTVNIQECRITVAKVLPSPEAEKLTLNLDVDEGYSINVRGDGFCEIKSETVWGALHALETFTQLLTREDGGVVTNHAPLRIEDKPRYSHRGVLIDSARHFLPVDVIKSVIDTLPLSKFNVLHWHIVDAQSFPVDTPSAPEMQRGSFGGQVYSMDDLSEIDEYATDRGVRIVYELDGPGHTASWGKGYPDIMAKCPKYAYNVNDFALNVVIEKTYDVLAAILKDVVTATGTKFMHLGGDEVVYGCWASDKVITNYMNAHGISSYPELLAMYVERVGDIASDLGTTSIFWEDTFIAGVRPPMTSIFDVWTDSTQIANVTSAGYQVIAAPQDYWYLDHSDNTWIKMYEYDPTIDLDEHARSLIVGGEASMWGEMVDRDNIHTKIWPTAAAVGERLWSARNHTRTDTMAELSSRIRLQHGERGMTDVHSRLIASDDRLADANDRILKFRCRMVQRGYGASPIQPGYCPVEYV